MCAHGKPLLLVKQSLYIVSEWPSGNSFGEQKPGDNIPVQQEDPVDAHQPGESSQTYRQKNAG
jgi:hypothetical protein